MTEIIQPKVWTEKAFRTAGFHFYQRQKSLVMARRLPENEAPLKIRANRETLTVSAGYMICYSPGKKVASKLEDYEHWPCEPEIFHANYRAWDTFWKPRPAERDLMARGCKPYYKHAGVWAKRLVEDSLVQSMESPEPALIPAGDWIVIDQTGNPYHMSDKAFRERYTEK